MRSITIHVNHIRVLIGICIFIIGFPAINNFPRPNVITRDLSTTRTNQTLILSPPGHSNATVSATYMPVSLRDNYTWFFCSLFAICAGLVFPYYKLQSHIWDQLLALDQGAKDVPKGEKLEYHLRGVMNLNFRAWLQPLGSRDTYYTCFVALITLIGSPIAIGILLALDWGSDDLGLMLEQVLNAASGSESGSTNATLFGSEAAHGSYSPGSWSCQIIPLLADPPDAQFSNTTRRIFKDACWSGKVARYRLLALIPLAVLTLYTALRPEKFGFTLGGGGNGERGWTAVPLDGYSDGEEEDDDALARFGGNAREQWLLDE